jgi:putative AlgH/UPF0301 family transcriptional regulator
VCPIIFSAIALTDFFPRPTSSPQTLLLIAALSTWSLAANTELAFDANYYTKWGRASAKLGVNPALLSGHCGRA